MCSPLGNADWKALHMNKCTVWTFYCIFKSSKPVGIRGWAARSYSEEEKQWYILNMYYFYYFVVSQIFSPMKNPMFQGFHEFR